MPDAIADSSSSDIVSRFPIELWAEEFESRFGSICQARILEMIGRGKEVRLEGLISDLQEDLEGLLTTAPTKLAPAFRKRSRVIARRMLVRTRQIFIDDKQIQDLIKLSVPQGSHSRQ